MSYNKWTHSSGFKAPPLLPLEEKCFDIDVIIIHSFIHQILLHLIIKQKKWSELENTKYLTAKKIDMVFTVHFIKFYKIKTTTTNIMLCNLEWLYWHVDYMWNEWDPLYLQFNFSQSTGWRQTYLCWKCRWPSLSCSKSGCGWDSSRPREDLQGLVECCESCKGGRDNSASL